MLILPPKTKLMGSACQLPLYYPAGPIRGADDWQADACWDLDRRFGDECVIANPSRYGPDHPLHRFLFKGPQPYPRQRPWERHYMKEAALNAKKGCLFFWCPTQSKTKPRPPSEGQYAEDTLHELGEWLAIANLSDEATPRLVIGMEPGFPAYDVLRYDFGDVFGTEYDFLPTLSATIEAAVKMAA